MVETPVYLDNMATTPVDPRVVDAMLPYFTGSFGNPSSQHAFGWTAAEAVARGREQVASLVGARSPEEIVFTSGATEANNLAIRGVADCHREKGGHIVTSSIEHKSVLDCCGELEGRGYRITYLPVDGLGRIDPADLRAALCEATILVSIMAANNEIGTIQPLREIGALVKEKGIPWHCDAVQASGRIPLEVEDLGVDLLSMSAHKIYGPKGIGALYVRSRRPWVRLQPQIVGGGQERGRRAGTLNVPGIVGLGMACELMRKEIDTEGERQVSMRQRLWKGLDDSLDGVQLNGHPHERLPGNLHVSFADTDGSALLTSLRDVALSAGSACAAPTSAPSHVLQAIGLLEELAHSSLRFGLGRFSTTEEIEYSVTRVVEEVSRLRHMPSPEKSLLS